MAADPWLVAIGAGPEQLGAIRGAKARGLLVLALDGDPRAPGLTLADEGLVVDIADITTVLAALEGRDLSGVLPTPIGRHLRTVGAVNDRFGLRGIGEQAAIRCTDKELFHAAMLTAGLSRPRQAHVARNDVLVQAITDIGLPCVLKPRFGSGSRGVLLLQEAGQVVAALAEFASWVGDSEPAIVESVLFGDEYGVDGMVIDGRFQPLLIRAKRMTPLPYRQEMAYLSPAPLDVSQRSRIIEAVDAAARVLGLDQCALNADVMLDSDGQPSIIEMAGRPPGLLIADVIMPQALGMNFYDMLIDFVLHGRFALPGQPERAVAFGFLPLAAGRVVALPGDFSADLHCLLPQLGSTLGLLRSGSDAQARGWAMAVADNTDQAQARLHTSIDQLIQDIRIDDH